MISTRVSIPHMIAIKRMSKVRFRKDMDFSKSLSQREFERKARETRARRQQENEIEHQPIQAQG